MGGPSAVPSAEAASHGGSRAVRRTTYAPPLPEGFGATVAEHRAWLVAELPGLGHWWMVEDPARGAAVLTDFWSAAT